MGSRNKKGYGTVGELDGTGWLTHRVVWAHNHGPIPKNKKVLHSCDNPPCCEDEHLFLGTHQNNMDDMKRKGRQRSNPHVGSKCASAKFTETQVRRIRASKESDNNLSLKYGVGFVQIWRIRHRVHWKHVL